MLARYSWDTRQIAVTYGLALEQIAQQEHLDITVTYEPLTEHL